MPRTDLPHAHPTAIISDEARIAEDVRIGPFAVIEGPVVIGPGCTIDAHARLIGPLTLGANNAVGSGAVLGGAPQHLGYKGEPTAVEVGDGNVFREHVTIHRGMPAGAGPGWTTCGREAGRPAARWRSAGTATGSPSSPSCRPPESPRPRSSRPRRRSGWRRPGCGR